MKNIEIKKMNKKQRLELAIAKTNNYGSLLLIEIYTEQKYRAFEKDFKQWMKITRNMTLMRGVMYSQYQILVMK